MDLVEAMHIEAVGQTKLTTADIKALYPLIRLEHGMAALKWFMQCYASVSQTLKNMCLSLAHFALTNDNEMCRGAGWSHLQL